MDKVSCSVTNCSHNNEQICHANTINVTGGNVNDEAHTSCASFLNSLVYSDLTNDVIDQGENCSSISCDVGSCEFNNKKICDADSISVNGNGVSLYSETNCSTFKPKNK